MSDLSPFPEAGPSSPKPSISKTKKVKGRKGLTGGTGKKGKIFLEDKSELLDLIGDITDTRDDLTQSRIDKSKARIVPDTGVGVNGKQAEKAEKRKVEKTKALNAMKRDLVEKQRDKIRRRKAPSNHISIDQPKKKRVGFA